MALGSLCWAPGLQSRRDSSTLLAQDHASPRGLCNTLRSGTVFVEPPPAQPADTTPPETTITKGPKDKTKKKTATFEFTSNEPGATFECSLDGKSIFKPCSSPFTVKVKKGKHSFQVQATDQAGNADSGPATDDWKVKKKKR